MIKNIHTRLAEAKIALAWCYSWAPDIDGRMVLGRCKIAADLDRELHAYDIVILLNAIVWNNPQWGERAKRALLDHELQHAEIVMDSEGDQAQDSKGRKRYRLRKHDIEEFRDVVKRNGLWKSDLQEFAKVLLDKARTPLLNAELPVVDLPMELPKEIIKNDSARIDSSTGKGRSG